MKRLSFILLFGFSTICIKAQDDSRLVVKAGESILEGLGKDAIFRYPDFTLGSVHIMNGLIVKAKLNYDRIIEQIQFINAKGDTLSLAEEETLKLIIIGNDSFYYDNGYIELLHNYGEVRFGLHEQLKLTDRQKIGAFGQTNPGVGIESIGTFLSSIGRYNLKINENLIFKKEVTFYMSTKKGHFFQAGKKTVLKEFSEIRKVLIEYLDKNHVNFSNKSDLEKLCEFIQLQKSGN